MSDDKKSTDPGLSAAERKDLRSREAKEALADHEEAQRALQGNLERLREERLAREAAAGPMLYPAPELPDDTPIENVRFSTRIRNAVIAAGWKTVGKFERLPTQHFWACRISERALSPIFEKRWACRRRMACGRGRRRRENEALRRERYRDRRQP